MKVVNYNNLPAKFPVLSTLIFILWHQSIGLESWATSFIGVVLLINWIFSTAKWMEQKQINPFKKKK